MSEHPSDANVKTALRIIEIIEIFAREQRALSLTQLAHELKAPTSSCQALLKTLVNLGYIYETGSGRTYYPTGRLLSMAELISNCDPILEWVLPNLRELNQSTTETVIFAKLNVHRQVVFLKVLESPSPIRYMAAAGTHIDAITDALGQALLSTLKTAVRQQLLSAWPRSGNAPYACVDASRIEQNIQDSLAQGWFAGLGDSAPDVGTISWPIKVYGSDYAIAIAGPLSRIERNQQSHAQELRFTCAHIEHTLNKITHTKTSE